MEKQIITREQAEALNEIFEKTAFTKDELIDLYAETGLYRSLRDLSVSELAKALYIGYEVEPEFKVGDWVFWETKSNGPIPKTAFKIENFIKNGVYPDEWPSPYAGGGPIPIEELRHATPEEIEKEKERRWWAKHGRDVWELREGDLLYGLYKQFYEVKSARNSGVRFLYDKDYRSWNLIKNKYKVACFVEDRKDVKDND